MLLRMPDEPVPHDAKSLDALAERLTRAAQDLRAAAELIRVHDLGPIESTNHKTALIGFTYLERFTRRIEDKINSRLEEEGHFSASGNGDQ